VPELIRCRPGFFNLAVENEFGCTPCFCYGHSSVCRPATGYSKLLIESMFVRGNERWSSSVAGNLIPLHYDALTQTISVTALDRDNVYFLAPDRFLGDQRASYNQDLSFTLRIGETGPAPTARDVILEGGNGEQITQPIFGQNNRLPTVTVSTYFPYFSVYNFFLFFFFFILLKCFCFIRLSLFLNF